MTDWTSQSNRQESDGCRRYRRQPNLIFTPGDCNQLRCCYEFIHRGQIR